MGVAHELIKEACQEVVMYCEGPTHAKGYEINWQGEKHVVCLDVCKRQNVLCVV